jgi:competence protein ComEA
MRALSIGLGILLTALVVSSGPAVSAQERPAAKSKTAASPSAPINLNTATVAQLETLPGIGARTAQLIVEHRQKNGNFKKVEELMNIKGIGEKSFLKIKPMVTVGPDKGAAEEKR